MASSIDVGRIPPFNCTGDTTSIGPRWKRWKTSFEFFADGKGVTNARQKKALLLHTAGVDVQDIFLTLPEPEEVEGDTVYDKTVRMLDTHFSPCVNVPFERHQFRQLRQEESETVDQFVVRLMRQAENCEFGGLLEEHARDQVIEKYKNNR